MERGRRFTIKSPMLGVLWKVCKKTACLQLTYDCIPVPQQHSPIQYAADPEISATYQGAARWLETVCGSDTGSMVRTQT